jgi:hypothetical protein
MARECCYNMGEKAQLSRPLGNFGLVNDQHMATRVVTLPSIYGGGGGAVCQTHQYCKLTGPLSSWNCISLQGPSFKVIRFKPEEQHQHYKCFWVYNAQ